MPAIRFLLNGQWWSEEAVPPTTTVLDYLRRVQKPDGSFGGDAQAPASIEETAVALQALCSASGIQHLPSGTQWLLTATKDGTHFPPAPIGLYFARLWYHEQLYPVVWTLAALRSVRSRATQGTSG